MRRFFIPPEEWEGERFRLTGKDAHHVKRVLRLRVGDELVLLDGQGRSCIGSIEKLDEEVTGRLVGDAPAAPELPVPITLAQALLKGEKFDWVIQKSTELGVARIQPLNCDRCVAQGNRQARWQTIAQEAAEQSERLLFPEVLGPLPLSKLPLSGPTLYCAERAGQSLPSTLASLEKLGIPNGLTLLIGPEGGFSPKEDAWLRAQGALPVTLGARILRAETAAIAALSMLLYHFGLEG